MLTLKKRIKEKTYYITLIMYILFTLLIVLIQYAINL